MLECKSKVNGYIGHAVQTIHEKRKLARGKTVNRLKKEMQSAKYLPKEQTEKPRRCSDDPIAITLFIFLYFQR